MKKMKKKMKKNEEKILIEHRGKSPSNHPSFHPFILHPPLQ